MWSTKTNLYRFDELWNGMRHVTWFNSCFLRSAFRDEESGIYTGYVDWYLDGYCDVVIMRPKEMNGVVSICRI